MPKYHSHLRVEADVLPDIFWKAIIDILGFTEGMTGIYGFMEIKLLDNGPRSGSRIEINGNRGSLRYARLDLWNPEHKTCELSLLSVDNLPTTTFKFRAGCCAQEGRSFAELDIINETRLQTWRDKLFERSEKLEEHNLARDYCSTFQQKVPGAQLVTTNVKCL